MCWWILFVYRVVLIKPATWTSWIQGLWFSDLHLIQVCRDIYPPYHTSWHFLSKSCLQELTCFKECQFCELTIWNELTKKLLIWIELIWVCARGWYHNYKHTSLYWVQGVWRTVRHSYTDQFLQIKICCSKQKKLSSYWWFCTDIRTILIFL